MTTPPQSGDPCPECGHYLIVVNSKPVGNSRVRYIGCRKCGFRPPGNKIIVPLKVSSTKADLEPAAVG